VLRHGRHQAVRGLDIHPIVLAAAGAGPQGESQVERGITHNRGQLCTLA
jgi:hypothetical protein